MPKLTRTALLIICAVIWLVAGLISPQTPYPHLEVYRGETQFSGTLAYDLLDELVTEYPGRIIGSEAGHQSAAWVAGQFAALGLQVQTLQFPTRAPLEYLAPRPAMQFTRIEPGSISDVVGVNVIGVLPGESPDAILIGAHRDVAGTLEGAEDDGSGTAVMLELARVLSRSSRKHTYVFASFDAEETGLFGSKDYAESLTDDSIELAICLDMVGHKDADYVSAYNTIAGGKRTALWSYAFMRQFVYAEQGRDYPVMERQHLHQALRDQALQSTSTDSGSFVAEGIPGLGFRVRGSSRDYRPVQIHTTADTMENISAETLELSGRLIERMVLTLEDQGIPADSDTSYAPGGDSYTPGWYVNLYQGLVAVLMLVVLAYDWRAAFRQVEQPMAGLRHESRWLLAVIAVALAVAGYLYWLSHSGRMGFPFRADMLPVALVPIITLALLRVVRRKQTRPGNRAPNQLIYSSVMLGLLVIGTLLFGWPKTMFALIIPVLFGTYFAAVPLLWSCITMYGLAMSSLGYDIIAGVSLSTVAFLAWAISAWLTIGVFGLQGMSNQQSFFFSPTPKTPPSRT